MASETQVLLEDSHEPPFYIEMSPPPNYETTLHETNLTVTIPIECDEDDVKNQIRFNVEVEIPDTMDRVVRLNYSICHFYSGRYDKVLFAIGFGN